jgi:hypothetical protein
MSWEVEDGWGSCSDDESIQEKCGDSCPWNNTSGSDGGQTAAGSQVAPPLDDADSHFLTVPAGLEALAREELEAHGCTIRRSTRGKVFFSRLPEKAMRHLRLPERVFRLLDCARHRERGSAHQIRTLLWQRVQNFPAERWHAALADMRASSHPCVRFRISCKLSDWHRRTIGHADASKCLSTAFCKRFAELKPDVRKAELEILAHLSETEIVLGVLLTSKPLSLREYIARPGTRCNVAYAATFMAGIRDGDVVLDPCSGSGTILFEAVGPQPGKRILCLASDIDPAALASCTQNERASTTTLHKIVADSTRMPLRSASVDGESSCCPLPAAPPIARAACIRPRALGGGMPGCICIGARPCEYA